MTRSQKKRAYIGIALVILVVFCAGIFAGYIQRNDKLCPDGLPAVSQQEDPLLGHTDYLCHDGKIVTH